MISMDLPQNETTAMNPKLEEGDAVEEVVEINLFPMFRHLFLTICILFTLAIIAFLIYQNGKNIYDNGI